MKPSDFSILLTKYLTYFLPVQRNLSANTIKSYRDTFKLLLSYCRDVKKLNIAKLTLKQTNVHPIYIRDYLGHVDITTTEVYARADNETKREVLERASERLQLPQTSDWEHDAGLIGWLSSLG